MGDKLKAAHGLFGLLLRYFLRKVEVDVAQLQHNSSQTSLS
jgi:hypothetical protein